MYGLKVTNTNTKENTNTNTDDIEQQSPKEGQTIRQVMYGSKVQSAGRSNGRLFIFLFFHSPLITLFVDMFSNRFSFCFQTVFPACFQGIGRSLILV